MEDYEDGAAGRGVGDVVSEVRVAAAVMGQLV